MGKTVLIEEEKAEYLQKLQNRSENDLKKVEEKTRLQADSMLWGEERRHLLTASMFGKIYKMRLTTSCRPTAKQILCKDGFSSKATH